MRNSRRRLILATILFLVLALSGLAAWRFTPSSDPVIGRWSADSQFDHIVFEFRADGAFIYHHGTSIGGSGEWSFLPGPVYEPTPGSLPIWSELYGSEFSVPAGDLFHPSEFHQDAFRLLLARNALQISPQSARLRVYTAHYLIGPSIPGSPFLYILEGHELRGHGSCPELPSIRGRPLQPDPRRFRKQSGTWLTRAWDRVRSLFP